MVAVGEAGVDIGVEGSGGGIGVALYAGDLHKSADGVASHAEVMLQAHLGGIFDLRGRAAEELAGGRGSHGAGYSHLTLTTDLCAGDRGVLLHYIAEKSGCSQSVEHLMLREIAAFPKMIQHAGHYA